MKYSYFNKFVVRTPLCSIDELERITQESDIERAGSLLIDFFRQPTHQEALYLASPALQEQFQALMQGQITDQGLVDSIRYSLMKYCVRMSTRPTPFGLFGGCSTGEIAHRTNLSIDRSVRGARHTRLDMHYACALAEKLAKSHPITEELLFYPNHSLYVMGDTARYVNYSYENGKRVYQISSIIYSDYVQRILAMASGGANIRALAYSITDQEVMYQDAEGLIYEMIESQLLVHELEPQITGGEPLMQLIETLKKLSVSEAIKIGSKKVFLKDIIASLESTKQAIRFFDTAESVAIEDYQRFADSLAVFDTEFELSSLLQTDVIRHTTACLLDKQVVLDIKRALRFLSRVDPKADNGNIKKFARAFYQRFEEEEIPLLYALDIETGIGYPRASSAVDQEEYSNEWIELLKRKLAVARVESSDEILLSDEDLVGFGEDWEGQPDTVSCLASVMLNNGHPQAIITGAAGKSAANLLGRFCHASPKIYEFVSEIVRAEEELNSEDGLLAEIIHLPESRMGNVLLRPVLRTYEIPYLARPSVEPTHQILPDDLWVSVRSGHIRLRSRRLNKFILPRLTNAHNFSYNTLPVYQFLCDLQTQDNKAGIWFSWGSLSHAYQYLPRVRYNSIILSPARWIVSKQDISNLIHIERTDDLMKAVAAWASYWKVSRYIQLIEGDNKLYVDLHSPLCVRMWLDAIKNQDSVELSEYLFTKENSVAQDENEKSYINEFMLAFRRNEKRSNGRYYSSSSLRKPPPRKFVLGDEWLYYKLYCGAKTADQLLKEVVGPAVESLYAQELIDKWFFIRYKDDDYHLRLRFHANKSENTGKIIALFREKSEYFLHNQLLWRVQTDTYQRELERYGYHTIECAESLFCVNSEMVLDYLSTEEEDEQIEKKDRWFFGLKGIDSLLNGFGLRVEEKAGLMETLAKNFSEEQNIDIREKKKLGKLFREDRSDMARWLDPHPIEEKKNSNLLTEGDNRHEGIAIVDRYLSPVLRIAQEWRTKAHAEQGEPTVNDWLASQLHMFMNRLFTANQRYHEMRQYQMLWRYYRSIVAQRKSL